MKTHPDSLDVAIATVIAWFRARAGMTVLELALEARVRVTVLEGAWWRGSPRFFHVGLSFVDVSPGESVAVHVNGFAPSSPEVRRAFLAGLTAVLLERETGERESELGSAHRAIADAVPLPHAPRPSEAAWWREQRERALALAAELQPSTLSRAA